MIAVRGGNMMDFGKLRGILMAAALRRRTRLALIQ
jgi:hypothetical protein